MKLDPAELAPGDSYKLMISAVVPRPIAFVTTINKEGQINAAPFSYFMGITSNPHLFTISVGRLRKGIGKDTIRNIQETREFVINLVNEDIIEAVVQTSAEYPYGTNELDEVGLTTSAAEIVGAPLVNESPVNIECKLFQIIEIGNRLQFLVMAEGVRYHIDDGVLSDDGKSIDPHKLNPVGRLGGSHYCRVTDIFPIERLRLKE